MFLGSYNTLNINNICVIKLMLIEHYISYRISLAKPCLVALSWSCIPSVMSPSLIEIQANVTSCIIQANDENIIRKSKRKLKNSWNRDSAIIEHTLDIIVQSSLSYYSLLLLNMMALYIRENGDTRRCGLLKRYIESQCYKAL